MKKLIAFITSIRLAAVLIGALAALCVLETFVPQGLSEADYLALYPRLAARAIVATGFGDFFRSWLFVVPALLFFVNLSACTAKRLVREMRKPTGRRHGPDVLHVGLMFLVLGGLLSFAGRVEYGAALAPGDDARLPDGALLHLDDFRMERYPDGRPREWVSVVTITKDGNPVADEAEIRVNRPLRHAGYTLYQAGYDELPVLTTKLEAVSDPGFPVVVVGLALVALGTTVTFARKIKEGA